MAAEVMSTMIQHFRELLSSGKYSDCTITCEQVEYKLHKAIVCPQAGFFDAAFSSGMKEEETGKVVLEEDKPEAVKSMVDFFYTLDYQPSPPRNNETYDDGAQLPSITHHALVYALADKYNISGLRELAKSKFKGACETWWNTREFHEAAKEVYMGTPEDDPGLRDIVVTVLREHTGLIDKPEMQEVIKRELLGYDLVMSSHEAQSHL